MASISQPQRAHRFEPLATVWFSSLARKGVTAKPLSCATLFAHQSRFAQGLKKGDRVSQGQTIGFVGSTGWSTGPHLHYEFRINNKPVDPLGIKMPEAIVLDSQQKQQFAETALPLREQLKKLAVLEEDNGDALQLAKR